MSRRCPRRTAVVLPQRAVDADLVPGRVVPEFAVCEIDVIVWAAVPDHNEFGCGHGELGYPSGCSGVAGDRDEHRDRSAIVCEHVEAVQSAGRPGPFEALGTHRIEHLGDGTEKPGGQIVAFHFCVHRHRRHRRNAAVLECRQLCPLVEDVAQRPYGVSGFGELCLQPTQVCTDQDVAIVWVGGQHRLHLRDRHVECPQSAHHLRGGHLVVRVVAVASARVDVMWSRPDQRSGSAAAS